MIKLTYNLDSENFLFRCVLAHSNPNHELDTQEEKLYIKYLWEVHKRSGVRGNYHKMCERPRTWEKAYKDNSINYGCLYTSWYFNFTPHYKPWPIMIEWWLSLPYKTTLKTIRNGKFYEIFIICIQIDKNQPNNFYVRIFIIQLPTFADSMHYFTLHVWRAFFAFLNQQSRMMKIV